MDIWSELAAEGIDKALIDEIRNFRAAHPAPEAAAERIPAPRFMYYGREVWGKRGRGDTVRRAPAACRAEGDGEKCPCGESGRRVRTAMLECLHVYKHRRGLSYRGRYAERRAR